MAIIDCPECGNKVSDKAENCPHCGFQIQQQETTVNSFPIMPQPKRNRNWIWISVVGIFVIAIIGIVYWYLIENNDSINDKKEVQITPEFIEKVHQYDELYPYSDGLAAVRKNGKYGFIDIDGDLVVPCKYDQVGPYSDSVFVAMDDDYNLTICDIDGNEIRTAYKLNPLLYGLQYSGDIKYRESVYYTNGTLCFIINESDEEIIINKEGNLTTNETQGETSITNDNYGGYVKFSVEDKDYSDEVPINLYGLKDQEGNIILPAIYEEISELSNGVMQIVLFAQDADWEPCGWYRPTGKRVYGYVDLMGNKTITESDIAAVETYKREQIAKKAEKEHQAILKGQARLEEERRQEEQRKLEEERRRQQESYRSQSSYDNSYSSSSSYTSFRIPTDVFSYLSGKTFYGDGVSLRINYDAVYLGGNAVSGAPIVSNITPNTAVISFNSPYAGGQKFSLYLNASNGTISSSTGEKFYLR